MHLILDTETTGLPDWKAPADAPGQPRIASIAMFLCTPAGRIVDAHHQLVRPIDWEMPSETAAINGLTTEILSQHGRSILGALSFFEAAVARGAEVVAHNIQFDAKMLRGELRRAGRADMFDATRQFCTMRQSTALCRIPPKRVPASGFKFPTLAEALEILCGEKLPDAHDAIHDALACRRVWLAIRERAAPAPAAVARAPAAARQPHPAAADDWGI